MVQESQHLAVVSKTTRIGWFDDMLQELELVAEVRGSLAEVTAGVIEAVAPFGHLEWDARAGTLTALMPCGELRVSVYLILGDIDCPTNEELEAPSLHVAAALAA
ncbi:MAG: hypothetical protein EBT79_12120 [Actinobacteria bacterium]|nr:hypothetical protein [Actinomycetota bacterium]